MVEQRDVPYFEWALSGSRDLDAIPVLDEHRSGTMDGPMTCVPNGVQPLRQRTTFSTIDEFSDDLQVLRRAAFKAFAVVQEQIRLQACVG